MAHLREVEPSRGDVGGEEDHMCLLAELRVRGEPLHLLLPAVQAEQRCARSQRREDAVHVLHLWVE